MQDKDRVEIILSCIEKILRYTAGNDYEAFIADTMLTEACVFNLSRIGELCHTMSEQYVAEHPEIPWNETYGLRNRIVHNYEGVNLRLVWEIISEDLPELQKQMSVLKTMAELAEGEQSANATGWVDISEVEKHLKE